MGWTTAKKTLAGGTALLLVIALAVLAFLFVRNKTAGVPVLTDGGHSAANQTFAPVDLTGSYLAPAAEFASSPVWKTVPNGSQVFGRVPFQINGFLCLWGKNNTKAGSVYPEEITGIVMNQKFETLYVYHGAFYSAQDGVPVCEVVFRYADGSSATNQLLYGYDMLDFVVHNSRHPNGPTSPRTRAVWTGGSFTPGADNPLRFSVTAIENPQPSLDVATIDLYSCKNEPAACILAMTAGKSGLMK